MNPPAYSRPQLAHALRLLPYVLLPVLFAVHLLTGSVEVGIDGVVAAFSGSADEATRFIVMESRLPVAITALLSGAALGVAGLLMQTVFANPLADPSLLGINAGAGLGAAVALLLLGGAASAGGMSLSGYALTVLLSGAGALAAIALLTAASSLMRGSLHLLIVGVMFSFLASALISILNFFATRQGVQGFMLWGMGDFSGVSLSRIPSFAVIVALLSVSALALSKPLNALLLGDDYARNLGFRTRRVRTAALAVAGLLCAIVTALCGPVGFIGLAAPHAARLYVRSSDHRRLFPATMAWGAVLALAASVLSRLPLWGGSQLPLAAITPLIGVPVVMALLLRRRG